MNKKIKLFIYNYYALSLMKSVQSLVVDGLQKTDKGLCKKGYTKLIENILPKRLG